MSIENKIPGRQISISFPFLLHGPPPKLSLCLSRTRRNRLRPGAGTGSGRRSRSILGILILSGYFHPNHRPTLLVDFLRLDVPSRLRKDPCKNGFVLEHGEVRHTMAVFIVVKWPRQQAPIRSIFLHFCNLHTTDQSDFSNDASAIQNANLFALLAARSSKFPTLEAINYQGTPWLSDDQTNGRCLLQSGQSHGSHD